MATVPARRGQGARATGPAWAGATARALAALPADEWTVIDDVRWPGRRHANVDHVVVGPSGVFVVDAKAWAGRISVASGLRENSRPREMAVLGAVGAAAAVARVVGSVEARHVTPVLCFVRDEQLVGRTGGVLVCSTANLVTMLRSRPTVLTPVQRGKVLVELGASVRATRPLLDRPVAVRAPRAGAFAAWLAAVFAR